MPFTVRADHMVVPRIVVHHFDEHDGELWLRVFPLRYATGTYSAKSVVLGGRQILEHTIHFHFDAVDVLLRRSRVGLRRLDTALHIKPSDQPTYQHIRHEILDERFQHVHAGDDPHVPIKRRRDVGGAHYHLKHVMANVYFGFVHGTFVGGVENSERERKVLPVRRQISVSPRWTRDAQDAVEARRVFIRVHP